MQISREDIKEIGSCNFCQIGALKKVGHGIEYPYTEVTVLRGNGIFVRMCDECKEKLKNYLR